MPEAQVHTLLAQVAVPAQSPALAHPFPAAHLLLQGPPQSISVSPPFLIPSLQVGTAQLPPVQTPVAQSLAEEQIRPMPHLLQLPPQSMSVSLPFLIPSVQPAGAHSPAPHTSDWQSVAPVQALPTGQRGQLPPQSVSL